MSFIYLKRDCPICQGDRRDCLANHETDWNLSTDLKDCRGTETVKVLGSQLLPDVLTIAVHGQGQELCMRM